MKLPRTFENILIGTLLATSAAIFSYFGYKIYINEKWLRAEQARNQAAIEAREAEEREKKRRYEAAVAERDAAIVKPEDMIPVKNFPLPTQKGYFKAKELVESLKDKPHKEVVAVLKTALEAIVYNLELLEYKKDIETFGKRDYHASFKHINENKKDDCDAGAIAAAAILSDDDFPPYVAILETPDIKEAHEVFVYKTESGKFGSIGINDSDCLFNCDNLEELRVEICKGLKHKHTKITVYDLGKRYPDFIDNDKDNDPQNLDYQK